MTRIKNNRRQTGPRASAMSAILIAAAAALMSGCGERHVWSDTERVPAEWTVGEPVEFIMPIRDSAIWKQRLPHDGTLSLRYSNRCRVSEVALRVEIESLDGPTMVDTVKFSLFTPDGLPPKGGNLGMSETAAPIFHDMQLREGSRVSAAPLEGDTLTGIERVTILAI